MVKAHLKIIAKCGWPFATVVKTLLVHVCSMVKKKVASLREIARIVKNQAPQLWIAALKTMNKKDVFEFVNNENIVLSSEFYFGTARTYIVALVCEGLRGTLKTFDLRNDPSQFIGLDYQELKRIIMGAKPKIIRSIIPNKHPILMPAES